MKNQNTQDEFWEPWKRRAPAGLPKDFARETSARARQAKKSLQAWRLFQLCGGLAIALAAFIGWSFSRSRVHEMPPGLWMFHAEASKLEALVR